MSGPGPDTFEIDRQIRDREAQADEDLATIRLLEREWEDYRQEMRQNSLRYEESGRALNARTSEGDREIAARMELDAYVARLAYEQEDLFAQAAQEVRTRSEAEVERLRQARTDTPWG